VAAPVAAHALTLRERPHPSSNVHTVH
jgi:hypothetical protein